MRRIILCAFLIATVILLTACHSTYQLSIETQQPAKITFPIAQPSIVIVNNAVAQPDSVGYITYIYKETIKETDFAKDTLSHNYHTFDLIRKGAYSVQDHLSKKVVNQDIVPVEMKLAPKYIDSLLWVGLKNFSLLVNETHYFSDVLQYEGLLRQDNDWMDIKPISPDVILEICDTVSADAVLSIDRMVFSFGQNLRDLSYRQLLSMAYSVCSISCSVYIPGRDNPITTFSIRDTVAGRNYLDNSSLNSLSDEDSIFLYQTAPEAFLLSSALSITEKVVESITPTWKISERIIYTSWESQMREATAYMKKDQWRKARDSWMSLFDSKTDTGSRVRIASNIAVTYEMEDQFDEALSWIEKSIELSNPAEPKKLKEEKAWNEKYKNDLTERILMNNILDIQYGED